jgi:hypothetical protein
VYGRVPPEIDNDTAPFVDELAVGLTVIQLADIGIIVITPHSFDC